MSTSVTMPISLFQCLYDSHRCMVRRAVREGETSDDSFRDASRSSCIESKSSGANTEIAIPITSPHVLKGHRQAKAHFRGDLHRKVLWPLPFVVHKPTQKPKMKELSASLSRCHSECDFTGSGLLLLISPLQHAHGCFSSTVWTKRR